MFMAVWGRIRNADALKGSANSGEFTVDLPSSTVENTDAPQIILDFGRNANGRLHFVSDSDSPATVTVQYGESEAEALKLPVSRRERAVHPSTRLRVCTQEYFSLCHRPLHWR